LSSDVFDEEIEISEDDKSAEVKDSDSLDDKQRQVERLERKIKEKVAKSLKASILINYIGEKEGVIVSDDDVRQGLEGMAKRLDTTPERLMNLYSQKDDLMESLRHSIYEDKVLDLLLSKSIKEKEVNE
jgi:trigger factor